jgi:branched-chain amino acid transport system ATP-binding protein
MSILALDHVTSGYGDLVAIRDVSLQLQPGEIHCLLGRNGAGKSTTLRTIVGLMPAISGSISYDGENVIGLPSYDRIARGIGFVQEGKRIFRQRSIEENLVLGAYSLPRANVKARLQFAYDLFPILLERKYQRAGFLSGGQQQMLAIAQALMPSPKVLLLDEPSAGLAPAIVKDVLNVVKELRDAHGLSVILVEQLAEAALKISDSVTVLDLGKVVHNGSAKQHDASNKVMAAYFAVD